jgi:hypothetical protein
MDRNVGEQVVYINTKSKMSYLPISQSSLTSQVLPTEKAQFFENIKKVLNSRAPITTEYKQKALNVFAGKRLDKSQKIIRKTLEETTPDDEYYNNYRMPLSTKRYLNMLVTREEETDTPSEAQIKKTVEDLNIQRSEIERELNQILDSKYGSDEFINGLRNLYISGKISLIEYHEELKDFFEEVIPEDQDSKNVVELIGKIQEEIGYSDEQFEENKKKFEEYQKKLENERKIAEEEIASAQVFAASNEPQNDDDYFGYKDNLLTAMKDKGYTDEEISRMYRAIIGSTKTQIEDILETIIQNDLPILPPVPEIVTSQVENMPPETQPTIDTTTATEAIGPNPPETSDLVDTTTKQQETSVSAGGSALPFKERYHPNSLLLYFNNSSYPDWDKTLESSVMNLEVDEETIDKMMNDIIANYGTKIFVYSKKSSTKEELNELLQLQFCVMRNLQIGNRAKTANVRLADLIKIDKIANSPSTSTPSTSSGLVVNPVTPVVASTELSAISRSEDKFIKDYDNYQQRILLDNYKNPNINRNPYRTVPKQVYTGIDPSNIAIVKGNNDISVSRYSVRRS